MDDHDYLKRMYEENKSKGYIELTREQIRLYRTYQFKGKYIIDHNENI